MREVWPRFDADVFLDRGFPYPGELAYGYRKGFVDVRFLAELIDGLAHAEVPLAPEELEISLLLSDEMEQIRDLALQLSRYERAGSGEVWQCYFTLSAANGIRDQVRKFDVLDSIWSDLGYPDGMTRLVYPREGVPAHLYPALGEEALSDFLAGWDDTLAQRDPGERLFAGA